MRHEMYNADTSKRIRRSLRNRFQQDGVVQQIVFGYIKNLERLQKKISSKDPAAELIYEDWFRRLENGVSFAEIADGLNEQGILPGACCRNSRWDCEMISRITRNPILKGVRVRNRKMSKRINRTRLRRSVNAPAEELLECDYPHLAFIQPKRYDRAIRMLDRRNNKYHRNGFGRIETRKNVPKKRTTWPG